MASEKRTVMNLDLNSMEVQRSRTVSLSDLVFDDLLSPMKAANNCRSVAMTPTSTQFLFPTSVTAEQEAYASGFARALEELYRSEGKLGSASQPKLVTLTNSSPISTSSQLITLNNMVRHNPCTSPPSYSLATAGICSNVAWPGTVKVNDVVRSTMSSHVEPAKSSYLSYLPTGNCADGYARPVNDTLSNVFTEFPYETSALKVENPDQHTNWHTAAPVCAASSILTSAGGHSSLSAVADSTVSCPPTMVDLEEQDEWRLERKRAKNRIAAARCQMRKMERINRLQEKVQELRDNNARLAQTVAELTSHVSTLRKQILMHTERGCRMMIPALS